jgi:hypothetical protein
MNPNELDHDPDDSTDPDDEPDRLEVTDDEGEIDRKIKQRIIDARRRIDDAEMRLFIDTLGGQTLRNNAEYRQARHALADRWGILVRQYIRAVRPLLTSPEVPKADHYWREVPIYERMVAPPDGDTYEWSRFATEDASNVEIARTMELPPSVAKDIPTPKPVRITGLRDVLENYELEFQWSITTNPDEIPPRQDTRHLERRITLPKSAYEVAVENTDEFLQQAGVGLALSQQDNDEWEV